MTNILKNEYQPDLVSSPGETLLETIETIGMSQAELARRMDRPVKTINEIIQKKAAITAETALQLEQVLGIPASFWLKREQQYRESLARLAEEQRLQNSADWLEEIPIQMMMRRGWIPDCTNTSQQLREAFKFFGVTSRDTWLAIWESKGVAYRRSAILKSDFGSVSAWLRQGERKAQEIECDPYNDTAFQKVLSNIRELTSKPVSLFRTEVARLCASAGVAVVFVQDLPDTGISGATQWLTPTKALIQLSLSYETDDHLWFTFFHEAGHILLHGKRQFFLETDQRDSKKEEHEADVFAKNKLIDPTQWKKFIAQESCCSKIAITAFAKKVNIAPGIVVGRLQQEKLLSFERCNNLKRQLKWDNTL